MSTKFDAPFIMRLSFYSPSDNNKGKNAAHAKYIGTRSGADRSDANIYESDLEEISPDTAAGHAKYANERPGSHGLFWQDSENKPVMSEIQNELKNHDGIVWRFILSLKEEDAIRLNFTNKQQWANMLRASVIDAAGKMGIKQSNTRWVAAFHEEKGHPHVHLMLWEKEPQRTRGVLSKGEKTDVKRIFMNEIYSEERTRLYQEQTAIRDFIRDFAKDEIREQTTVLQNFQKSAEDIRLELQSLGSVETSISPRLHDEQNESLVMKLYELSEQMPEKGRIAFAYMPEPVKSEALQIADWIMTQPQMKANIEQFLQYTESITKHHTHNPEAIEKARQNAYKDLQKRIAQVVLKGAGESRQLFSFKVNPSIVKRIRPLLEKSVSDSQHIKDINKTTQNFSRLLVAAGYEKEQALQVLLNWNKRSNLNLNESILEKNIEKAFVFQNERKEWNKEIVIYPKHYQELFSELGAKRTPKWMWSPSKGPSKSIAHSVIKTAWKNIEIENKKAEAEGQILRKQQVKEQQRRNTKDRHLDNGRED